MTLREAIVSDASSVFLSTNDFAETVTYYPNTYFGEAVKPSRSIVAVVFREQVQSLDEEAGTVTPLFHVHVKNNAATGVASDELDLGGDQIEMSVRDGQAVEKRTITRIVTQDHSMLVLECR